MTQETMTKEQWKYSEHTCALADTGDYEGYVQFTNGKDILQSCGDEMEEEQLKQFCDLLNLMPDLWSHKCDGLEFENSQLKQQLSAERERYDELKSKYDAIVMNNMTLEYNAAEAEKHLPDVIKQYVDQERERAVKLIGALNEYIVLLGEELDEVMGFVNAHQWKSTRFEKGEELRQKIKQTLNEYDTATKES